MTLPLLGFLLCLFILGLWLHDVVHQVIQVLVVDLRISVVMTFILSLKLFATRLFICLAPPCMRTPMLTLHHSIALMLAVLAILYATTASTLPLMRFEMVMVLVAVMVLVIHATISSLTCTISRVIVTHLVVHLCLLLDLSLLLLELVHPLCGKLIQIKVQVLPLHKVVIAVRQAAAVVFDLLDLV